MMAVAAPKKAKKRSSERRKPLEEKELRNMIEIGKVKPSDRRAWSERRKK
jgi:hypothetical protein